MAFEQPELNKLMVICQAALNLSDHVHSPKHDTNSSSPWTTKANKQKKFLHTVLRNKTRTSSSFQFLKVLKLWVPSEFTFTHERSEENDGSYILYKVKMLNKENKKSSGSSRV